MSQEDSNQTTPAMNTPFVGQIFHFFGAPSEVVEVEPLPDGSGYEVFARYVASFGDGSRWMKYFRIEVPSDFPITSPVNEALNRKAD